MKKFTLIAVMLIAGVAVFAGPHHRGGHHRGHHHRRGGDGVWLAAGITGIVANGLQIVNTITQPRVVVGQPVVTTPIVTTPVVEQPVVVPAPQPVVVQPAPVVVPAPQPVYYQPRVIYTQPVYRYAVPAPVVYRY